MNTTPTKPSCLTCPSYVAAADTQEVLGRPIGSAVCFRHGWMLGRAEPSHASSAENLATAEWFAEECDEHEMPRPGQSFDMTVVPVAVPIVVGMREVRQDAPPSCTACRYYVPQPTVQKELGWLLGACSAKGHLIYPKGTVSEAINCDLGVQGTPLDNTDSIRLFPQFNLSPGSSDKKLAATRAAAAVRYDAAVERARHAVDPREYVTDRPVSEVEARNHVRAWREVKSPEGFQSVFLPIFDGRALCGFDPRDTYGGHRPDLYIDHQDQLYKFAVGAMETKTTPVLTGSAGTGKTEWAFYAAFLMDLPGYRVSIEKGTESWHLTGEAKLVTSAEGNPITQWADGRLALIEKPGVIVFDEPNLKPEIFELLRPLFDQAGEIRVDADQGRVFRKSSYCFPMCAQNPAWELIYAGTEMVSAADLDRTDQYTFSIPTPEIEMQILRNHCKDVGYDISTMTLDKIMQIAWDIRTMVADGSLGIAWGMRAQIKVARKTQFFALETAYRLAILDGLPPEDSDAVLLAVRGVA